MFKRKEYVYHVVYGFQKGLQNGNGHITIYRNSKIRYEDDIVKLKEYIEEKYDLGNIVIYNWIRLKNAHYTDWFVIKITILEGEY